MGGGISHSKRNVAADKPAIIAVSDTAAEVIVQKSFVFFLDERFKQMVDKQSRYFLIAFFDIHIICRLQPVHAFMISALYHLKLL